MTAMSAGGRRTFLRHLAAAVLVSGAMTAVLGYQIEKRAAILRDGTDILLKTAPVDPRDLFRGDYVVLNYDISSVPGALVAGALPTEGATVRLWVRLRPGEGGFWTVAEASFAELMPDETSVVIRSQPFSFYDYGSGSRDRSYAVDYGIERFYVPEGEGLAIEEARDDAQVSIAVRVNRSGDAQIRALLVDGKPVYNEPLY